MEIVAACMVTSTYMYSVMVVMHPEETLLMFNSLKLHVTAILALFKNSVHFYIVHRGICQKNMCGLYVMCLYLTRLPRL